APWRRGGREDGERGHREFAGRVGWPAHRDDTDRHIRSEAERALKQWRSVEWRLSQKFCQLSVGGDRRTPRSQVVARRVGKKEMDGRGGVIRIRDCDSRVDGARNLRVDAP